jgi:hypothetical protein
MHLPRPNVIFSRRQRRTAMALLEDLFKLEGAAGATALGVGALLLAPTILPAVGRMLRPVAKELVKTGMLAYDEAHGAVSGAYDAASDLVAEARAERAGEGSRVERPRRTSDRARHGRDGHAAGHGAG